MRRGDGIFIVIEGIDAVGKKTQTAALVSWLRSSGLSVATMSFPIYGTAIGKEIKKFLAGKTHYPPQVRAMLYAANRWEELETMESLLSENDVLIMNRYSGSNLAYGVSSGLSFDWLLGLEAGLPEPDLVLLLDAPPAKLSRRKKHNKDSYERDARLQLKARRAYLKLSYMLKWKVIDADSSVDETREAVLSAVSRVLSKSRN